METLDYSETICIIGAGASGITVGKNFIQAGIPCEIIEREDDIGGNWYFGKPYSRVYQTTHLISSKTMTSYTDYPMPESYPDYPNHQQVLAYLRDYAQHYKVNDIITFNTAVQKITRTDDGKWAVTLKQQDQPELETRVYGGLVIANGHHWDPKWPELPGQFSGTVMHSAEYKSPDMLRGKRVLVIGAGNTGCDIAVDAAIHGDAVFHSTRRGYWYIPKYIFGKPTDVVNEVALRLRVPLWLRRIVNGLLLRIIVGDLTRYGLRKPDHRLQEFHPLVNQQITYFLGHGKITPKDDVAALDRDHVQFKDGSEEAVDLVICATGYKISFPFIDSKYLDWTDAHPDLYLHVFHRRYDNLFVAGLIQPDSGQFWIVDLQAQLMARFVQAIQTGNPAATSFQQAKRNDRPDLGGGVRYYAASRHALEIAHHVYRSILQNHIKAFD